MTYDEFIDKFHIKLNPQQLAAVKSVSNPTLLLAVPGSGKTTVLVTRLGYMIYCCGIKPEDILTVTYTVAATKDMKARFAALFGQESAERLEFRTINGICARIINYYGSLVGKEPFELVTDEGVKSRLLSEIYIEITKQYPAESDLKDLSTRITYIKNMQLSPEQIDKLSSDSDMPLHDIYSAYCSRMRAMGKMDYDDQMVYALTMLRKSPQVLSYFQDRYRYICVDEAQDTSKIQHIIISLLASRYDNMFMVGDEDQSIYGFRAAYPEALLDFEKNHPGANVLLMEENFRSNAKIVEAADRFIQKNCLRHPKSMRAARPVGSAVREIEVKSRKSQYTYLLKVASDCSKMASDNRIDATCPAQTAVLYRDNESILPVVDLLERAGINYKMKNADITFFTHRVVRDVENIIRFAENPYDTELFMQIYYKIGTYMSRAAAIEACSRSAAEKIPVLDAALRNSNLPEGTERSVKAVRTHLAGLLNENAVRAVYRIHKFMGYDDYLERMHINGGKIQILEAIAEGEPTAQRLLERLSELAAIIRDKKYSDNCNFILSTIHSSKGLEYDTVYLLDAKDGVFPEKVITDRKKASRDELMQYEEERRLYYVAVTRAKDNLNIFSFKNESSFTAQLFERKAVGTVGIIAGATAAAAKADKKRINTRRIVTESEYMDKMGEIVSSGCVRHITYGRGKLLAVNGDELEVAFAIKTMKCRLKFMMERGLII